MTNFADINIDCQEHIFKHLDLIDLLNIADTSKQFKIAADLVYRKMYGDKPVYISSILPCRNEQEKFGEEIENIQYAQTCLQLLRNFGQLITSLKLDPINLLEKTNREKWFTLLFKCVITYINEYCAESLTKLHIHQCPNGYLKFLKPLPNVETVKMDSFGFDGLSKDSLNKLFPKMNVLEYIDFNQSLGIIENHFPHLNQLNVFRGRGHNIVSWNSISPDVLELNPQILCLKFNIGSDLDVLRSIENLQHLEELHFMWDTKYTHVDYFGEQFWFRTVKKFKISFNTAALPVMPFRMNRLELFDVSANAILYDELYEFFRNNQTIVYLKLLVNNHNINLKKISTALPNLRKVKIGSIFDFVKENILDFVNELPFLKKAILTFTDQELPDYDEFVDLLGNEWQTSVEKKKSFRVLTLERLA